MLGALPHNLIVSLNRFEFDIKRARRVKMNTPVCQMSVPPLGTCLPIRITNTRVHIWVGPSVGEHWSQGGPGKSGGLGLWSLRSGDPLGRVSQPWSLLCLLQGAGWARICVCLATVQWHEHQSVFLWWDAASPEEQPCRHAIHAFLPQNWANCNLAQGRSDKSGAIKPLNAKDQPSLFVLLILDEVALFFTIYIHPFLLFLNTNYSPIHSFIRHVASCLSLIHRSCWSWSH